MTTCALCQEPVSEILWQDSFCRVVLLDEPDYPAYCRVELVAHIKEMTDLPPMDRARTMKVVFAVEAALRAVLNPEKINLASLGNMTPHLHWHIVPRYADDKHFPNSHWGEPMREVQMTPLSEALISQLKVEIKQLVECALAA